MRKPTSSRRRPVRRTTLAAGTAGVLVAGAAAALAPTLANAAAESGAVGTPEGYATLNGGTTGGEGGDTVTTSDGGELAELLASDGPLIIRVEGMLTLPEDMNEVTSDKTVLGVGDDAGLRGSGLNISEQSNVIIQNLTFDDWANDAINIEDGATNVWIDHNTFTAGGDGAVDIKSGSDFVTVSWNHSTHEKNMLLGADDADGPTDEGHLRVTYHHNFFDGNTSRSPLVRFGDPVHVYNNYYLANDDYGARAYTESGLVVEGNFFQDVEEPFYREGGDLVARDNCFANSGPGDAGGDVEPLPYDVTPQPCEEIPNAVQAGAGAGTL